MPQELEIRLFIYFLDSENVSPLVAILMGIFIPLAVIALVLLVVYRKHIHRFRDMNEMIIDEKQ